MSFYDLTKDFVLSAKQLFNYRNKRDSTIPSRGGQKDFEPDGSWMQAKSIEAYLQERTSVLAEPRVEKVKNLVEGMWDGKRNLVNLKKPGKFWAHMGFTDNRRNWLYPEEALFLMEANTLMVYYDEESAPMSIQEAYSMFLGTNLSMEQYQVFSHLRRLGYVVLRHEEQPHYVTEYERQINLDKCNQSRAERKGKFLKKGKKFKQSSTDLAAVEKVKGDEIESSEREEMKDTASRLEHSNTEIESVSESTKSKIDEETAASNEEGQKDVASSANENDSALAESIHSNESSQRGETRKRPGDDTLGEGNKKARLENEDSDGKTSTDEWRSQDASMHDESLSSCWFYDPMWAQCFRCAAQPNSTKSEDSLSTSSDIQNLSQNNLPSNDAEKSTVDDNNSGINREGSLQQTVCDAVTAEMLPDIANKKALSLVKPSKKLLPPDFDICEEQEDVLHFDVEDYRHKNPPTANKQAQREEERESRVHSLEFSFAEWTQRKPQITATNWAEYKQKLRERMAEISASTPVDHLWRGEVVPLVRPQDAVSNESVLACLSIIQSVDNEDIVLDSDCIMDVKVCYDVHLPNSQFRKSMPGTPNHRVCITKCSTKPPGLTEIHQAWSSFKDGVPLHWAVVDSGEIAFYVFDNRHKLEVLP